MHRGETVQEGSSLWLLGGDLLPNLPETELNMKKLWPLFFVLSLAWTSAGCTRMLAAMGASPPEAEFVTPMVTPLAAFDLSDEIAANYPGVDGSTSALPLQMAIACHHLGVSCEWHEGDFLSPTRRFGPDLNAMLGDGQAERIGAIHHTGTHGAYSRLIAGEAAFILVARAPSVDELQAAQSVGVTLELSPVARDAFVFLVHTENKVENLALEDIRRIYSGAITTWEQVGGRRNPIHTYQRNRNSGSQELMEHLVMRGTPMVESPDMILASMMGPINAISEDTLGIGYSVYFYAEHIFPHQAVKMIAVDGVKPAATTIASGSYPLATEVYAVLRADAAADSPARALLHWLLTDEGQQVVAGSGYVPIRSAVE
jgi:phosphate transport system substrate-binding protein